MPNTVTIGSKIKVKINGQIQELQIVGSAEVDPKAGKISYLSPIGEAVLGREVGEGFDIVLPDGRKLRGWVIKIFK